MSNLQRAVRMTFLTEATKKFETADLTVKRMRSSAIIRDDQISEELKTSQNEDDYEEMRFMDV